MRSCLFTMAILLAGCGGSSHPASPDGGSMDAGSVDGGSTDGGSMDAAPVDGGSTDGGSMDAAPVDGGSNDGGPSDASLVLSTQTVQTPQGDGGVCTTTVTQYVLAPGVHTCGPLTYPTNPPTSGPHYPVWAAYTTYSSPVPHGYLVHNLEHGAVVIGYNCPAGCAAEVAQLQAYVDARPADPLCTAAVHARIIIEPDPDLNVQFAAASWGWALTSDCFDLAQLGAFLDAHYAMAPENTCADGMLNPTCP